MELNQNIFYDEFSNKLASLHNALVDLQDDFNNKESVHEIFRAIHTIKGSADLLGMFEVVSITHKAEDLLQEIREDKIKVNESFISLYFELEEYLKKSIDNTVQGIYDDTSVQDLAIYLENELEKLLKEPELLSKKTILVVEGQSINRYMIKKIAHDIGHDVYITDNGIDALKKMHEKKIDIVFADITLSCERCTQFLVDFKNDILYDHIPIVVLIDTLDENTKQIAKEVHAKAWLQKPIEASKLKIVLDKLVV
jgi:chemotaxis protein histidine kinase CheA